MPSRVSRVLTMALAESWPRLERAGADQLRRKGQFRRLVLGLIQQGKHPSRADLAAALHETPPDAAAVARVDLTPEEHARFWESPPADVTAWLREHISEERQRDAIEQTRAATAADTASLCAYVARHYVLGRARPPGGRRRTRTFAEEQAIALAFFVELDRERARREADSRRPGGLRDRVKQRVAKAHRISMRTLEGILKGQRVTTTRVE